LLEWSIDTNSFDTTYFEGYGIYRWDGSQYAFRQVVTKWNRLFYDDLTANNVDGESYSYKIDFRYSGFVFGPSDSIQSIWLRSNGGCDSVCLVWNQYDGWSNPTYDVYIDYKNQWVKWNSLPLTDTVYCMGSDTLDVGIYNIKVVTQDSGYVSESNYVICVQPEPPTITIPNVMTPNGDGRNDYFVIRNLLQYDYRHLIIKNRWGRTVYESDQYNNDWDGRGVSDGVYYGIVQIMVNGQLQSFTFMLTILHN
jgi:gliding motility-associated-like protein